MLWLNRIFTLPNNFFKWHILYKTHKLEVQFQDITWYRLKFSPHKAVVKTYRSVCLIFSHLKYFSADCLKAFINLILIRQTLFWRCIYCKTDSQKKSGIFLFWGFGWHISFNWFLLFLPEVLLSSKRKAKVSNTHKFQLFML